MWATEVVIIGTIFAGDCYNLEKAVLMLLYGFEIPQN